jgi:hypothetical protein
VAIQRLEKDHCMLVIHTMHNLHACHGFLNVHIIGDIVPDIEKIVRQARKILEFVVFNQSSDQSKEHFVT